MYAENSDLNGSFSLSVWKGGTRECGTPSHLNNTEIHQDVACDAI